MQECLTLYIVDVRAFRALTADIIVLRAHQQRLFLGAPGPHLAAATGHNAEPPKSTALRGKDTKPSVDETGDPKQIHHKHVYV